MSFMKLTGDEPTPISVGCNVARALGVIDTNGTLSNTSDCQCYEINDD